jgi:drug/metabolite transporter (DMT)-like permease
VRGSVLGVAFAVSAMLMYTYFYILNRRARTGTDIGAGEWFAGITASATAIVTPVTLISSSWTGVGSVGRADLLFLLLLATAPSAGHLLMSWAHAFVAASRSSLFLLGTNVVAIVVAWPLHDEPITLGQSLGCTIVLAAVAATVSRPRSVIVLETRRTRRDRPRSHSGRAPARGQPRHPRRRR